VLTLQFGQGYGEQSCAQALQQGPCCKAQQHALSETYKVYKGKNGQVCKRTEPRKRENVGNSQQGKPNSFRAVSICWPREKTNSSQISQQGQPNAIGAKMYTMLCRSTFSHIHPAFQARHTLRRASTAAGAGPQNSAAVTVRGFYQASASF
jgi:hypothetical protein